MLPQLERQFLQANLAQANALLNDCSPADDPIGHHQYSQLVEEMEQKLAAMPRLIEQAPAGVALFFGGRPVIGSQGIQASFSGRAIEKFQKIVSQRFAAQETGPLGQRGRLPMKDNTHMLVTDIVRGSFGFVLQSALTETSDEQLDTSLKSVVDQVADTISRVAAQDEAMFDEAVAEIDDRQKSALTDFFKLLNSEGATLRLVEGERDFELDQAAIERAKERVEALQISEETEEISGQIVGWGDISGRFELKRHDNKQAILGAVSREAFKRIQIENPEPYHKHFLARIEVRRIAARNRQPKIAYTLLGLEPADEPSDWPVQAIQQVIR
ncbi:MAG: hypothetical protein WCB36_04715 [Burkholderiales bacterium]